MTLQEIWDEGEYRENKLHGCEREIAEVKLRIAPLVQLLELSEPRIAFIHPVRRRPREVAFYINESRMEPIILLVASIHKDVSWDCTELLHNLETSVAHELIHAWLDTNEIDCSEHPEEEIEDTARVWVDTHDIQQVTTSLKVLSDHFGFELTNTIRDDKVVA